MLFWWIVVGYFNSQQPALKPNTTNPQCDLPVRDDFRGRRWPLKLTSHFFFEKEQLHSGNLT